MMKKEKIGLNRKTKEDVWIITREIYKKTSISCTKLNQKIRIEVNKLDYAIGVILPIECEDKK